MKYKEFAYLFQRIGITGMLMRLLNKYGIKEFDQDKWIYDHYYKYLSEDRYLDELKDWYHYKTGRSGRFITHPETFNDKIQWLKLYDKNHLKTVCCDKYKVREWVKEKIGGDYLIDNLGIYDTFEEIDFNALPDEYVIKANHGSGMVAVCKKSNLDIDELKKKCNKWLNTIYGYEGLEWFYLGIKRKLIVEKYIKEMDGNLHDFKIHCFNGKPMYIQVIGDRDIKSHSAYEAFYDTEWKKTGITYTFPEYENEIKRPERFDEMLNIAQVLSEEFIYVRVDLYNVGGRIFFGEMTFAPANGTDKWNPPDTDYMLGKTLDLGKMKT